jgi:hypothetical protein
MNTFEIVVWVLGIEQKVIVTEPTAWNETEFALHFNDASKKNTLMIKLENGHWLPVVPADKKTSTILPRQLEIDSIGYQIAKHWCGRLEKQLQNFRICI